MPNEILLLVKDCNCKCANHDVKNIGLLKMFGFSNIE